MALAGGGSRARRRLRKCVTSIRAIKEHASRSGPGKHWFEKGTMRFFGTRVIDKVFPGKTCRCSFFVTSEKRPRSDDPRAYSVRMACGGKISTVGEFQAYSTRAKALTAAKKIAKKKG
jgi:hypothetical protein